MPNAGPTEVAKSNGEIIPVVEQLKLTGATRSIGTARPRPFKIIMGEDNGYSALPFLMFSTTKSTPRGAPTCSNSLADAINWIGNS
jgi:hypothetical protein